MSTSPTANWRTTLRGTVSLFLLGMVGVLVVAVSVVPTVRMVPELARLPYPLLLLLAAVNSTVLLAVFVTLGTLTAPKINLHSHVFSWATRDDFQWETFRTSVPQAVGVGVSLFIVATLLDVVFTQFVAIETATALSDAESLRALAESIPIRLFYGGITEELLIRWGLMAPIAWVIWRVQSRNTTGSNPPTETTMWAALVLSSVLFGVGHLPAAAATSSLTLPYVVRIVSLNAVVGIGFGWLYWHRSLETAMIAHMMFHVTLVAFSATLIVLT
ncbi:CPBP family intramembrane glutamic endopeptidase [Salinigranum salinum]|uniref:CPBP family intramembrane glutamic endopeptidase n=1 Tax=Salinigranum salinum TaxID=1364937 RepID=UPI001260BD8A|nr:CPBP family intramembrane glutamic endopeptidase [Salinigranum salinum]